jgi:hypothetical protein
MGSIPASGTPLRLWREGDHTDATSDGCSLVALGWRVLSFAGAAVLGFCYVAARWFPDEDDGDVVDLLVSPEVASFAFAAR